MKDTTASLKRINVNKHESDSFFRSFLKHKYLEFMALPGVVWMIVFIFFPMYGILMAFTDYSLTKPILSAPWVGFKYFIEYFQDDNFLLTIQNTLGISLLQLIIAFPLTIVFTLLLNELVYQRYKRITQTITYLPHFLSWAVLGALLVTCLTEVGPLNDILMNKLHLISEPIPFLSEPKYFWGLTTVTQIWKETGWNAIVFLAAITGIDPQLYESADLDGATRLQKVINVTLPSISNIIALMFILNVGYLLNSNFDQILVLSNQLNLDRSLNIDLYVYRTGISTGRFSYATAIGTFRSVIALFLLLIANQATKKITGNSMF